MKPVLEMPTPADPVAEFRVRATVVSLLVSALAIAVSWWSQLGKPTPSLDFYALPVLGSSLLIMSLWLWLRPKHVVGVHLTTLSLSAVYMLLDLRISSLIVVAENGRLGAGAPWFSIIVVIAFLVLSQRTATLFSALYNIAAIIITTTYVFTETSNINPNTVIQFHVANIILTALIAIFGRMRHHYTEARAQAYTDTLTGIQNRRAMQAHLNVAHRNGNYALLLIDVDHFKNVNDHYGHAFGDIVLREIAFALNNHMRVEDCVARWGGEEFLVVAENTTLQQAQVIGERLRRVIIDANPGGIRVTVSIGLTIKGEHDEIEHVLARADAALYRAKNSGRDQVRDTITLEHP
jgi:diguanylate cyclase (GGDEF)-like protein